MLPQIKNRFWRTGSQRVEAKWYLNMGSGFMFTLSVKTKGNIEAQNEKKDFMWTDCLEEEKEKEDTSWNLVTSSGREFFYSV